MLSRRDLSTTALLVLAASGIVLCVLVASPFIPSLTWAISLAVIAHPVHLWIARHVPHRNLAAGIAIVMVSVGLLAPVILVGQQVVQELTQGVGELQEQISSGELESRLKQSPRWWSLYSWARGHFNSDDWLSQTGGALQTRLAGWLRGTASAVAQLFISLFILFFLFRDHHQTVDGLRRMLPLRSDEAGEVLARMQQMVQATLYGNFVVALAQGALGGLMFWILGIPSPLLWSVVMALLSLVPSLGAFLVWLPAAAIMAGQGHWIQASILGGWGVLVVGSIDNILYPVLVGSRIRLHTVVVFIATLGGLVLFGAAGLVLGPLAFAFTLALMDVVRERTSTQADGLRVSTIASGARPPVRT